MSQEPQYANFEVQGTPEDIEKDLKENRKKMRRWLVALFVYVVLFSILLCVVDWNNSHFFVDGNTKADHFTWPQTFGNAIYFTIINVSTVGFGDISPESVGGKVIACINAFVGVIVFGAVVAKINSYFLDHALSRVVTWVSGRIRLRLPPSPPEEGGDNSGNDGDGGGDRGGGGDNRDEGIHEKLDEMSRQIAGYQASMDGAVIAYERMLREIGRTVLALDPNDEPEIARPYLGVMFGQLFRGDFKITFEGDGPHGEKAFTLVIQNPRTRKRS